MIIMIIGTQEYNDGGGVRNKSSNYSQTMNRQNTRGMSHEM